RTYNKDIPIGLRTEAKQVFSAEIISLNIASVVTESEDLIPLTSENEIPMTDNVTVKAIQPVQASGVPGKVFLPAKDGFKFELEKFRTLAVCAIPRTQVLSDDPYTLQGVMLEPQIALIPLETTREFAPGTRFFGVIECDVYRIAAQDEKTGQTYKLGFHVDG